MKYEKTKVKKPKNGGQIKKDHDEFELKRVDTGSLIWFVVKRHKFGLVLTWAILATVLYIMPSAPDLLFGMIFDR